MARRIVLALLLASVASAAVPVAAAAAELVMFRRHGCAWCDAWERDVGAVFDKTDEAKVLSLRRVDLDAPRLDDLKGVRGVAFAPTFVVLDGDVEIGRIVGYPGEDFFWGLLGRLVERLGPRKTAARVE
jgi:thioredoxin-related protein